MEEQKPQESAEEKLAKMRAAQAKAHAKWRASPKGQAYYQKRKEQRALAKDGA